MQVKVKLFDDNTNRRKLVKVDCFRDNEAEKNPKDYNSCSCVLGCSAMRNVSLNDIARAIETGVNKCLQHMEEDKKLIIGV